MSKVPFAEYKIGFEKFLKSESGTIYVQCKTFNEALYELQELMKMVDFEKFHALSYSTSDRLYYWNFYKENTIFCLTDRGSTLDAEKEKKKSLSSPARYGMSLKKF